MTAISPAKALQEAQEFAREVIRAKQPAQLPAPSTDSSGILIVHHYYPDYFYYGPCRPVCHIDSCAPCGRSSFKKEDGIIAVASAVILVGSYFLGREMAKLSDASTMKEIVEDKKRAVAASEDPAKKQIQTVLGWQDRIIDSMQSQALSGIATKAALIGAAAIAGAGAWFAAVPVMVAGSVAAGVAGLVVLHREGYVAADTAQQEDALQLLHAARSVS
jgi:hypothetical protein